MNNLMLLTGAGFSKNFGGFDNSEITNVIKEKATNKKFKTLENTSYEQIYQILNSNHNQYTQNIRDDFNKTIHEAYSEMEINIEEKLKGLSEENKTQLKNFLNIFNYVFTLNQDLFIEKTFGYHSLLTNQFTNSYTPINPFIDLNKGKYGFPDLVTSEFEKLLSQRILKNKFKYIKLHGSFNWKINNNDNVHIMGVGFEKKMKLRKHHLLQVYLSFFGNRLTDEDGILVLFGYRFGDLHINDYIYWGINKGLRLILLNYNSYTKEGLIKKIKTSITKTYSYDNLILPTPKNLEKEIQEKAKKIYQAIIECIPLQNKNLFEILTNLTTNLPN